MKVFWNILACSLALSSGAGWAADARTSVSIDRHGRPSARADYNGTRDGRAHTKAAAGVKPTAEALAVARDHDGSTALSYSKLESSRNHYESTEIRMFQSRNQQSVSVSVSGGQRSVIVMTDGSVTVEAGGTHFRQTNNAVISTAYVVISESAFDEELFDEPLFDEGECDE